MPAVKRAKRPRHKPEPRRTKPQPKLEISKVAVPAVINLPRYFTLQEISKVIRRHPTTVARIFRSRKGVLVTKRGTQRTSILIPEKTFYDYLVEAGFDPTPAAATA